MGIFPGGKDPPQQNSGQKHQGSRQEDNQRFLLLFLLFPLCLPGLLFRQLFIVGFFPAASFRLQPGVMLPFPAKLFFFLPGPFLLFPALLFPAQPFLLGMIVEQAPGAVIQGGQVRKHGLGIGIPVIGLIGAGLQDDAL